MGRSDKIYDQKYLFNIDLINWLDQIEYGLDHIDSKHSNLNEFKFKENIFFDAIAQFKIMDFQKIKRDNPFLLGQIIPKNFDLKLEDEVGNFLKKNIQKYYPFKIQ